MDAIRRMVKSNRKCDLAGGSTFESRTNSPPPCFIGLVKEGVPFLGKREPWMGLSFQHGEKECCRRNFNFFKFNFRDKKNRRINWLSRRDATKRAVCGDEVGGKLRLDGRLNATKRAFDPR